MQHRRDVRRVRAGRLAQQHRDVDGHPERLVRLVHRHRVAARGDRDCPDAVDRLERAGDRRETRDLRTAAGHEQDVVVVVDVDVQRVLSRLVELGHGGALRGRGARPVCGCRPSEVDGECAGRFTGCRERLPRPGDATTAEVDHGA